MLGPNRSGARTRRSIAVALALALLGSLLVASGAEALSRSFWGVVDTSGVSTQDFAKMHRARVGVVRVGIYQNQVESAPGVFTNWSTPDAFVGGLAARGIKTLPELLVAQSNPPPPVSGDALTRWKQFVKAVVNRYKPGGAYWSGPYQAQHPGARARPIRAYQVYNEPNLPKYFPSNNPVRDYAKLLKASHGAIKGSFGHAKVVLAGIPGFTAYRGWKFLDRLYRVKGVKRSFDIGALHPYAPKLYYLRYLMRKFRKVMKRHGDGGTQVWITEFGFGSARANGDLNKGPRGQARMLTKTFKLFRKERHHWRVHGVVWFQWRDPPHHNPDCTFCSSSGLLHSNFQPKPALRAFKHFTR
jgi:Glycosyl hydrolase catalytic core